MDLPLTIYAASQTLEAKWSSTFSGLLVGMIQFPRQWEAVILSPALRTKRQEGRRASRSSRHVRSAWVAVVAPPSVTQHVHLQLNEASNSGDPGSRSWQLRLTPIARLVLRRLLCPSAFAWAIDEFLQSHVALPLESLLPTPPSPRELKPLASGLGELVAVLQWAWDRSTHQTPIVAMGAVPGPDSTCRVRAVVLLGAVAAMLMLLACTGCSAAP